VSVTTAPTVRVMHTSGTRESNAVSSASDADGFPSPSPQMGPGRRIGGRGHNAVHCGVLKIQAPPRTEAGAHGRQESNLQPTGLESGALIQLSYARMTKKAAQSRVGVSGYRLHKEG
jgi:hypothetical protein